MIDCGCGEIKGTCCKCGKKFCKHYKSMSHYAFCTECASEILKEYYEKELKE